MKKFCVYCHTFPNGKKYIGITCRSPKERWYLKYQTVSQPKIKAAVNKYGWDNIKHEILLEGLTEEEAKAKEREFIKKFDTFRNGYNGTIGGDSGRGTYLNANILNKIRAEKRYFGKKFALSEYIFSTKFDVETADFFNEIDDAVMKLFPTLSNTDIIDVARYWYEVNEYLRFCSMCIKYGESYAREHFKHCSMEAYIAQNIF